MPVPELSCCAGGQPPAGLNLAGPRLPCYLSVLFHVAVISGTMALRPGRVGAK